MMKESDKISKEYSKAISRDENTVVSKTGGAKFADYSQEDLSNLPPDIKEQSFGCGNPLAFSEVKVGHVVLDLGCGAGLDLLIAAERVGKTGYVIGVDFNDDMLNIARKRVAEFGNIELRKGRIEDLPVASSSVDWMISNCVINLSQDKQKVFQEVARVLKPGGKMIVSDIVAEHLPWWVRHSGVLRAACGGGGISEKEYLDGLTGAGLENAQVNARHYYEPSQLASIISDSSPTILSNIRCCGKQLFHTILTKLAEPVSKRLWSAKISARAPMV